MITKRDKEIVDFINIFGKTYNSLYFFLPQGLLHENPFFNTNFFADHNDPKCGDGHKTQSADLNQ